MTPEIDASLAAIAGVAGLFEENWWIIGSAAAVLAGADVENVQDIDLLVSERDARMLLKSWRRHTIAPSLAPHKQFRSRIFARFESTPMPIEMMAGFEMRMGGEWKTVWPQTRIPVQNVFIPAVGEQVEMLAAMNRRKDAPRLEALKALSSR